MKAASGDGYRQSECVPVWRCPPFGVSLSVGPAVALQPASHCWNLRAQHCETREEGIEGISGRGVSGRGQRAWRIL